MSIVPAVGSVANVASLRMPFQVVVSLVVVSGEVAVCGQVFGAEYGCDVVGLLHHIM